MKKQTGFTLIELAIVLVIIGLLLGGVLKGQELINSAKIKNMASDFKNVQVFIYGYQDKYKALPGDDLNAATHLTGGATCTPTATASHCVLANGVIEGQWNSSSTADESYMFWSHVRLAGLAPGATDPAVAGYAPLNADGGRIGIQSVSGFTLITSNAAGTANTGMSGAYVVCSAGILGKFASQLDTTMDDGNPDAGSMRVADASNAGKSMTAASLSTTANQAATQTVCMSF